MKKIFWLACLTMNGVVFGDSGVQNAPEKVSHLVVGGNFTHERMRPYANSSFCGNLGGAQGLYEYRPMDGLYAGAKFIWRKGELDGYGYKRSFSYIDVQERIGYTGAFDRNRWLLSLFTGFGFIHMSQKLSPNDLRFNYNEFYVPVGLFTDYQVNWWFNYGIIATWMPQILPTVTIIPLKGARWVLSNSLNNFYLEIPFTFTLTKSQHWAVIVNPFYEHWQDGHSTARLLTGIPLGLPSNTYNAVGVELNLSYRF